MQLPPPTPLIRWLERHFLCEVPTALRVVGLTFDDGPDRDQTPRVLEILARGGHTATFFCIGRNAARAPHVVSAAAEAGHEIANHTYSHPPLILLSFRKILEEIRRTDWILSSITGVAPVHFRPPMGWATPGILRRVAREGYRPVLGSIYPADTGAADPATIVRRTVTRLAPGRIVILHDGSSRESSRTSTLRALPEILGQMEARGLRGVTIRELLQATEGLAPELSADPARDRPPAASPGSRS